MVAPIRGYGFAGGRRTDARPAGRFILREDAGSARAAAETAALCGPSPLLLLQEAASPAERDRRALARGRALLAALDDVQRALLSPEGGAAALARLASLAEGECGADAALRETVEALSLRARVILARRGT